MRCHDIVADPLPESSFDLVHVRWMLHWPPDRQRAIGHLVSALRPGGWLLAEEPDFVTMCEAGSSSCFRTVVSAAVDVHEKAGGGMNSRYGRDLMRELSGYGLVDTGGEGRVHMLRGGDDSTGAAWLRLTVEKARGRVLESAAVTPAQFDETIRLLDDPDFLTMFPLTFAVWGRRA